MGRETLEPLLSEEDQKKYGLGEPKGPPSELNLEGAPSRKGQATEAEPLLTEEQRKQYGLGEPMGPPSEIELHEGEDTYDVQE